MNIYRELTRQTLNYDGIKIPIIFDENDIAWVGAYEIIVALGYKLNKSNMRDAIRYNIERSDRKLYKEIYYGEKKYHLNKLFISEYGLYDLVINSRKKSAKKFKYWITKIVLPSIRKYGSYVLLEEHKEEYAQLLDKINYLEEQNKKLKTKKKKYPNGGYVYVVDYSNKYENLYRIGKTGKLTSRKGGYDTHNVYDKEYVYYVKHDDPYQLEECIRSMLYKYKFGNKDFYNCKLSTIKKAFTRCVEDIKYMRKQKGGSKSSKKDKFTNPVERMLYDTKKKSYVVNNEIKNLRKIIDG